MQAVTWTVATLLITINGYLLMDFFSSEIRGPLSGSLLCVAVVVYASFVLYLILRGTELSEKIVKAIRSSFSWQRLPSFALSHLEATSASRKRLTYRGGYYQTESGDCGLDTATHQCTVTTWKGHPSLRGTATLQQVPVASVEHTMLTVWGRK